ncbi:hypothetical protein [Haloarcula pelagica]|uniref:hypothetical protein n=1 Tax=Haloarcula pelagica TaxID=3033389 RepID=UPI0024C37D61|nr:hypothetical protein [Halomicroarcula sp. YJ-61-S]
MVSRRTYLRGVGTVAAALSAGCSERLPGSDGDILVQNWDEDTHEFTVTMDRGEGYDVTTGAVTVAGDEQGEIADLLPNSDWPYPFLLHTSVDGDHVATTHHKWNDQIGIVYRADGTVLANEVPEEHTITPSAPYRTENGPKPSSEDRERGERRSLERTTA